MNYAKIKFPDVANGTGCRVSLFVSGCRNHCRGCFNPETWRFDYGEPFTEDVEELILKYLDHGYVNGLSVLGGDPMEAENAEVLLPFLKKVKEYFPDKNIWMYTGYVYESIKDQSILQYVDVLVDGPFIQELKDLKLAFKGSSNQRILQLKHLCGSCYWFTSGYCYNLMTPVFADEFRDFKGCWEAPHDHKLQ